MSSELQDLIAKAETIFEQEKYDELVALLSDAVLEKHKAIELYFWRARAHFRKDELELGHHYAESTIACDREHWTAFYIAGIACYFKDDFENAILNFTKVIAIRPDNSLAFYNRGHSNHETGEYDKAIEDYSKAIELKPDYAEAYYNRGYSNHETGEYNEAIEDYSKAIDLKPDNADAYYNRGISYADMSDNDKAIVDYTKAIDLKPDNADAYCNRGCSYQMKDEHKKAIEDFTKSIDLNPDDAFAIYSRGASYCQMGEYHEAIVDFSKSIELDPKNFQALCTRGSSYHALKEYDKAIVDYNRAIDLEPNAAQLLMNRGIAYNEMGNCANAIADFTVVIELNKDLAPFAYNNRGTSYSIIADYHKAIENYTKGIHLKPDNANLYLNRGNSLAKMYDYPKAIEDYTKAIELKPDFADAYSSRGHVRIILSEFEHAKIDADLALSFPGLSSWNYFVKGLVELEADSFGNALLYFNSAVLKKGLTTNQVKILIESFYSSGYPFMAHRLLDSTIDHSNYSGLNTYIGQIVQDCKPIKQWLMHMHRQSDMWASPTEYLKWMGIIHFYMGDAVTAFRIFDMLDGDIDNDFQLKYYCLKAAMLVYPPLPDTTDLDSYLRGYEKDALQYIVKEDFDEEQYHYALLLLFHAGRAEEVSHLIPYVYLQSTQYVAAWAAKGTGQDDLAKDLLSEENMKRKISDFHIPFKKVVVPKERLKELTDDEKAQGEKQIDLWLDNLKRVVRYYEIESEFNEMAAQNKEVLRFWDAWDLSLLSDIHRKQLGKELANAEIEEKEEKIESSAEGKKPNRQAISEDPVHRSWVDTMMNHTNKEFLLNDIYGHIKKGKKGFDYKTCFRVIEYLYLNQKISSNDFVMLSVYAAIMYYIPVDLVMDRMEQATSPLTGKMVEFIFEDVPSSYVNGLNKFVFAKMKLITQKLLEEKIEDYNALKEVLLERLAEEQIVLSEQELIFDEFPLSHFDDIEKLAAYAGYN